MTTHDSVGAMVRAWRLHRRMTQEQLASKAGLSKATVCNIEASRFDAQLKTLGAIAFALDMILHVTLEPTTADDGEAA